MLDIYLVAVFIILLIIVHLLSSINHHIKLLRKEINEKENKV